MTLVSRVPSSAVALETTLLLHGVPAESAPGLARELSSLVRAAGVHPALVALVKGVATVGVSDAELQDLLAAHAAAAVPKANTANLGVLMARGQSAATTVATTMELAAAAGLRVFATGGLGGVHRQYGQDLDVSADLAAFTRFPVAVVTAGVKSILDVAATREALETLGIPVVGYQTDDFPAFYLRRLPDGPRLRVDARFDSISELARFVRAELARTGRGIVVANPIPAQHELDPAEWSGWMTRAADAATAAGVRGRDWTPFVLQQVHMLSGGRTLRANLELVKHNARVAGELAAALARTSS